MGPEQQNIEPVVVLRKQPRILDADETGEGTQHITQVMTSSQMEISSNGLKVPNNLNQNEVISKIKAQPKVFSQEGNSTQNKTPSSKDKEELAVKALEKINAAQQILKHQKADQKSAPGKKNLEGLVHVKPKQPDNQQKADTAK